MKTLDMMKNKISHGDVDQIIIIASSKDNGLSLEKELKKNYFKDFKLSYRILTRLKTSDGVNYGRTITILWNNWWKNKEMLEYVRDNLINVPGVRALGDLEPRWLTFND